MPLINVDNINPTGNTYLRLRITPDTVPNGTNAFEFSAVEEMYVAPRLAVKLASAAVATTPKAFARHPTPSR